MFKVIPRANYCLVTYIALFMCAFQKSVANADGPVTKPYLLNDEQVQLLKHKHREIIRNESSPPEINAKSACSCGLSTKTKIVGGAETAINEFPWMTYILITITEGTLICSGFLVTNRHVITAGHCLRSATTSDDLHIILGDHNITDPNETESVRVNASGIKIHPDFNKPNRHNNDIAIVTLKYGVKFTFSISPICLPPFSQNYDGIWGTIAGWGPLIPGNNTSMSLMLANVPIISQAKCEAYYAPFSVKITSKMICAGGNYMDACQGDSGGPLMISVKGRYFAIGVVSFGVNCGTLGIPGAYTRVDTFFDFIVKNTIGGKICF